MPRSPRRGRRAATIAASGVLGLALLTGCAKDAPQDTWQPAGENAQKIQNLQWPVFLIAGIVMLLVFAAVGWAIFRYRDRGQPIPEQSHGKPALEIALTILPALILIGVAIPTVGTLMALSKTDDTECYVNVTGQQWWWEIDYPTQEGCGGIDRADRHQRADDHPHRHQRARPRHQPRRHPQLVDPPAQRQARHGPRPGPDRAAAGRPAGDLRRPVHRVLRALPRQHAHGGRRPRRRRLRGLEGQPAGRVRAAGGRHAGRHRRADVHRPVLALPPGRRPARQPTATR